MKLTVGSWHWSVLLADVKVSLVLFAQTDKAAAGKSFSCVLHREPRPGTKHCCPKAKDSGRKASVPNPHIKLLKNHW